MLETETHLNPRRMTVTLQSKLDAFKADFEAGKPPYNVPYSVIETMHRATAELIASGAAQKALKAGDKHPDLRLELIMRDHVGDLVADAFDMALRFGEPPVAGFTNRKILETRILTVASPAYLDKHGKPEHPRDLINHTCIDYQDPATGRAFKWEFHHGSEVFPIRQSARLMVSDVETMIGACCEGAGIAQIMELGSQHIMASGKLVELLSDWPDEIFSLYAIFPSRRHRAAKVRVFTDLCSRLLGRAD
ncbi:substrate binding domain-containing protein [Rhizobium sp. WYJ-E13]|uniref:substrate binding domain-containing protein n=1 Tax=Rhizobium sp. WYJ-E13 TaxID=2849093 RepID=UPI001C1F159D|nr:substrate binding domain-containing protein [Rhizobium sp. WYJ-E13]QWW71314.1 substrate binding domain-containing protein [Rhizobium sp. WYJ-E13]